MIIVETNSCPSGQKSMPLLSESDVCVTTFFIFILLSTLEFDGPVGAVLIPEY